jgi:RES domain-containing protein
MSPLDSRALGRLPGLALSAVAYRNQAKGFDPRSGDGARRLGGRYNPPQSFPVLYLCLTRPCAVAELTRQAARQSLAVADLLPRELWEVRTDLDKVVDLRAGGAALSPLGLVTSDLTRDDFRVTREVGEAAHEHGFQAILAPSATGVDNVLAIFPDNLAGAVLHVELVAEWNTIEDLRR